MKMRIGASIILKNTKAVQSYKWNMLRPLGQLSEVLKSLDEYQCDEISITRCVRAEDTFENFTQDLKTLRNCKTLSPVSFGGGIRSKKHLLQIDDLPIERLIFSSSAISGNYKLIEEASAQFGHQAIQCLLPLCKKNGEIFAFNSGTGKYIPLSKLDLPAIESIANEIIIYDISADGHANKFNFEITNEINISHDKLILTGGIGNDTILEAKKNGFASVLIDNRVLHQEHSIERMKKNANM